jgi:hypothetical protein
VARAPAGRANVAHHPSIVVLVARPSVHQAAPTVRRYVDGSLTIVSMAWATSALLIVLVCGTFSPIAVR